MDPFFWTCPYCLQNVTITSNDISFSNHKIYQNNKDGQLIIQSRVIICPSANCKEYTVSAQMHNMEFNNGSTKAIGAPLLVWNLRPSSMAKPYPEFIPLPIRQDYTEACLIADLSPKASATLSRRCLQEIIYDFWGESKNNHT